MPLTDVQYRYVSLDSDHDLSSDTLALGLDGTTFPATATYQSTAPPGAAGFAAPRAGLTRYWWRVLLGPGQTLVPSALGNVTLYGLLTDSPELLHPQWTIALT